MGIWLTMIVVGLLTYATRVSFILLFSRKSVHPQLRRALRFVPPAVLSAIIFPELLLPGGVTLDNPRLIAGLLAALVAWRFKNVAVTIVVGMAVLLTLQTL